MKFNYDDKNVKKLILFIIIPSMLGQFINVLYTIVDRVFIGNMKEIGDICLGAIGLCAPLTTVLSSFSYFAGVGAATLMMQSKGEGKDKVAASYMANGFLLLIIFSLLATLIFYITLRPLLSICGATDLNIDYAYNYMKIYLIGSAFYIIGVGLNQFIVAMGASKTAMISMAFGAVINIIFDPIFIFVFNMGIEGAAIATAISQFCVFLFNIIFLLTKFSLIKLSLKNIKIKYILKILKRGVCSFIIFATDSIAIICINASIKKSGGEGSEFYLTVFTIVSSVYQLVTMPLLGISSGSQGIISYTYGKADSKRLKSIYKTLFLYGFMWTIFCFIVLMIFPKEVSSIFSSDEEVLKNASKYVRIYMIVVIPLTLQYIIVDGFTALGYTNLSLFLSLERKVVVVLVAFLLPLFIGISGIYFAEVIGGCYAAAISSIAYFFVFPKVLKKMDKTFLEEKMGISTLNM